MDGVTCPGGEKCSWTGDHSSMCIKAQELCLSFRWLQRINCNIYIQLWPFKNKNHTAVSFLILRGVLFISLFSLLTTAPAIE